MKGLGLIVRTDHRGLGAQTRTLAKFLNPERVLVVEMGRHTPYREHLEQFPDAHRQTFPMEPTAFGRWAKGLDWVLSCETFYGDHMISTARVLGVRTALQYNFEFAGFAKDPDWVRPDVLIAPSTWMTQAMPHPHVVLPPPVDRAAFPYRHRTEAKTFVHVVGHRAKGDRAGSKIVWGCLRHIDEPATIIIRAQTNMGFPALRKIGKVEVRYEIDDISDPSKLYEDADVLVAPRRYGGLSLPIQEASSMGLPVIALDREPENQILDPRLLVGASMRGKLRTQGGDLTMSTANPRMLADKITQMTRDPDGVSELSEKADAYARSVSWETIGPEWERIFGCQPST